MPSISLILSTYNNPKFLEKVLAGYSHQSFKNFEIIIADDGSTKDTKDLIHKFNQSISQNIFHVWHEDNGFRKCKILNKAISKSSNEYLVFSDGDCIPNRTFLETHNKLARKGHFLSGGHLPLCKKTSNAIKLDHIKSQICFNKRFLMKNGQPIDKNYFKLIKNTFLMKILDQITPTKPTFNGNNSSAWREDIIFAKGLNEKMGYGSEDNELGYRLNNNGIKSIQIRNRAKVLHLYHLRPYRNNDELMKNKAIANRTLSSKIIQTSYGIKD
jgi:glycosyltransferase involved in cell wall biosynthesis